VPSPAEERADESREAAEAETASAEEISPDAMPREEPTAAAATAAAATAAVITAAAAAAAAATAAAATAPAALADAITAATAVPQETSLEAQLSVATAYEAPALALLTNQPLTHTHVASHHATPTLASPFYRAPPMAAGSGGGARASSVVSAAPAVPPAVPPAQGGGNFFSRGFDWLTKEISEIAREFGAEAPPPIEVLRPIFFAPAPTAAVLPIAPHASTSAATGAATGALSSSESNEKDREALLGRTASKSRGKGAQGGSVEERAIGGASATTAEMHEMVHAAHQRGEQLSDLGDKSQQLADNADDFLQMAKQLRKQEEKGLFGALFG
jgi:hypothetical protein